MTYATYVRVVNAMCSWKAHIIAHNSYSEPYSWIQDLTSTILDRAW